MKHEEKLRSVIRQLINEEINPSLKKSVTTRLESTLREAMDDVLMQESVHKEGLSEQQAAFLYRKMCKVVESVLEDYTTTRKPNDLPYDDYLDKV